MYSCTHLLESPNEQDMLKIWQNQVQLYMYVYMYMHIAVWDLFMCTQSRDEAE